MPTLDSSCETVLLFGGNDLPVIGASVIVANKQLVPSPFVNLVVEKYKVGEKVIGGVLRLTLNGTAVGSSFDDVVEGQGTNGTGIKDILELAQMKGCVCVEVKCGAELINGYGRITSVSANEGNQPSWVNIAPYTIEIELLENNIFTDGRIVIPDIESTGSYVLKSISESLSWSINEDTFNWGSPCSGDNITGIDGYGNRHIKVNFDLTVTGQEGVENCVCATGQPQNDKLYGLEAAEAYLIERLKDLKTPASGCLFHLQSYPDSPDKEIVPAFNSYIGGDAFLDFRTIQISPIDNSINLTGEIIFRPSGCENPEVFTTLNIEHNITTADETVTINGSIIGLVDNNFNEIIQLDPNDFTDCAFNVKNYHAEAFLAKINDPDNIIQIANCYAKKPPFEKGYIEDTCPESSSSGVCEVTPTSPTEPPLGLCQDMRIISSQINRNISAGEINFTFNLSNVPSCEVAGTTKLDVTITHDKPHDSIVEIIIPGRGSRGPLIQNLCCNSSEKYDINIDASLNRKTCTADIRSDTINQLRKCAEKELEKLVTEEGVDVSCWFKTNDVETVGTSTYKLSRTYVKPSCP